MAAISTQALPLPGGSEGAGVRVHPLRTADMLAPPNFLARPGGPLWHCGPSVCTSRGPMWITSADPGLPGPPPAAPGPILVDTGLHPSVADDGKRTSAAWRT